MEFLQKFHAEESGQDLVEYALVLAAIAVVAVAGSGSLAGVLNSAITTIDAKISNAIG